MKRLIISCCFFLSIICNAQKSYIKEVELAENHFALESQVIGVKAGFLKNMDSAAIGVGPSGFVSQLQTWTTRPEVKSTLIWEPKSVFASENGLWGSTHGPWYTKDSSGKLINPGYFFTIWQRKNINEPYKFSLDMGIQLAETASIEQSTSLTLHSFSFAGRKSTSSKIERPKDFFSISSSRSLAEALQKYTGNGSALLVSGSGRVFRSGIGNVTTIHKPFHFTQKKSFELEKGLAFYEYGTMQFEMEPGKEKSGQYVHVWVNQNGKAILLTALYRWD